MLETSRRLVLRYEAGQFTFRHANEAATDEQLFNLAHHLNAFQEDDLERVVKVRVYEFS
jgi:hypothetical protein